MWPLGDTFIVRNQVLIREWWRANAATLTDTKRSTAASRSTDRESRMKRFWIAGAVVLAAVGQALAADLPEPAPPPRAPAAYVPVAVPAFNWGGVYLGLNGGYGFGTSNWTVTTGAIPAVIGTSTGNFNTSGFLIGGTLGANFQANAFVFGVEGDLDWSSLKGSASAVNGAGCVSCQTSETWLGTGRARAGVAWDRVLFFLTGGAAFGNIIATTPTGNNTSTKVGWTVGGGVEVAFAQNWTAKVEYLYVNLGNGSCTTACATASGGFITGANVSLTENLIRLGVNYKF